MENEAEHICLKVIDFKEGLSKHGIGFRVWSFKEVILRDIKVALIEILTGKFGTRIYTKSYEEYCKIGDYRAGRIIEYKSTPYFRNNHKDDFEFSSIEVVVMTNEDGLKLAAKALQHFGAYPYDEHGNIHKLTEQQEDDSAYSIG